jgi:hypothetical protein
MAYSSVETLVFNRLASLQGRRQLKLKNCLHTRKMETGLGAKQREYEDVKVALF